MGQIVFLSVCRTGTLWAGVLSRTFSVTAVLPDGPSVPASWFLTPVWSLSRYIGVGLCGQ